MCRNKYVYLQKIMAHVNIKRFAYAHFIDEHFNHNSIEKLTRNNTFDPQP